VLLTNHPLLVPWSWKSRAIPLPTLWATTGPVTETLDLYYQHIAMSKRRTDNLFLFFTLHHKKTHKIKHSCSFMFGSWRVMTMKFPWFN